MKSNSDDFFSLYENPETRHLVKPIRVYEENGREVKVYPSAPAVGVSFQRPFMPPSDDE